MKHYEVTFIVDPVLSGDEIKATENVYVEMLKNEGATIVHIDELGLKQLAYAINKKNSGIYYNVEFTAENGNLISKLELSLRRDERIMRFLTIALDKYGIKYNADKRAGLIGKVKKKSKGKKEDETPAAADRKAAPAPFTPAAEAPAEAEVTKD
jgi:small subunit ribosomal protein S6